MQEWATWSDCGAGRGRSTRRYEVDRARPVRALAQGWREVVHQREASERSLQSPEYATRGKGLIDCVAAVVNDRPADSKSSGETHIGLGGAPRR
jgi:hypothetical protein